MTLDYTCSHCGATETYNLVPVERETEAPSRPIPELDFTCSSCGATDTYQLVKS